MSLTIQILCQNNLADIEATLQSLLPLESKTLVGNCGSTDGTLDICRNYGCKIVTYSGNRSEIRNRLAEMSETDWQFYLNPGEVLSTGHDLILGVQGKMKRAFVIYEGFVGKEARLWKKGEAKFVNPVYETLDLDDAEPISAYIIGCRGGDRLEELLNWKKGFPQAAEVDYYLACQHLLNKEYDKFLKSAELFLFRDGTSSINTIMTRYYLAQVHLYVKKNVHEATRNLVCCLAEMPLMAEFWCLLGDCYYRAGVPEKAAEFFKIAKEMGRGRPADDPYPVEFAKYGEYPGKMIELCEEIRATLLPGRELPRS